MSEAHTPGRPVATGNGIHIGMRCLATTHMDPPAQRQADARRFAACWIACAGVPVEVLEAQQSGGLPWSVADQIEQRVQRDELLAALIEANEFIDGILQDLKHERIADWYPEGAHNSAEAMSESMRLIANRCADFDSADAAIAKATKSTT